MKYWIILECVLQDNQTNKWLSTAWVVFNSSLSHTCEMTQKAVINNLSRRREPALIKETGWEYFSLSHLNWNWKQTLLAGILLPLLALNLNVALSWLSRIRPANSGLAPTTENQEFITWVGPLANNWQHGKAIAPRFPPFPPLLPKLEFVLFTQLRRNLLQQEVHAGLSPVAEPVYEREEETLRKDPDTHWRLSEGQDGWRPSLTNGNNQPRRTE